MFVAKLVVDRSRETMIKWPKQITPSFVEKLIRAEKDVRKAVAVFDSATEEYVNGYKHDHRTFGVIIAKLVASHKFELAEEILARMKNENCCMHEHIFITICKAYGSVRRPRDAIRVFQEMEKFHCERTEKSYVTVMDILVKENQLGRAISLYKHMRKLGIPPCVASLNVLIKALCRNAGTLDSAMKMFREMPVHGCVPDAYTYGTLINGLSKLGEIGEARKLFAEMKEKGCSPTVVTYTCLIHGLSLGKNADEALRMFAEMEREGIEPNRFTYNAIMGGLCNSGRSLEALKLMENMVSSRLEPNTVIYSTLIHGLCSESRVEEASDLLDRMKILGLKPDAGLYSKIINGYCDMSKYHMASNFVDEMCLDGVSPNRLTWSLHVKMCNRVIDGLCGAGDLSRAIQSYANTRNRGINIVPKTFNSLIDLLCRRGDVHRLDLLLEEMTIDGCVPDESSWLSIVQGILTQNAYHDFPLHLK